jgi:hypothetical protein
MPENTTDRKPWSDSDRAMAYLLFNYTKVNKGRRLGSKQFEVIARSRKVIRTAGSWSYKLTNYIQADKYLSGATKDPIATGNAEKKEFPELDRMWKLRPMDVIERASLETVVRDDEAYELLQSLGIPLNKIKNNNNPNNNDGNRLTNKNMNIETRLVASLAAKPFSILAGGAGTGKTNTARMVAAAIAGLDSIETVAVGADWTDNRALLGFRNLLAEGGKTYVAPPALRIILKALANPGKPYFLILDEMNLSHVERYFSDFLSSMESKEKLKLHDSAQALFTEDGISVSGKVDWPRNLFIIGTVNIDETTYMFSPKVLDRAHVIEFKVSWDEIAGGLAGAAPIDIPALSAEQIDAFMGVALIKDKSIAPEDQKKLLKVLEDLHIALAGSRFVFAHRTARECLNFIASTQALAKAGIVTPTDTKGLIDLAILQKTLPKLNGAAGTLTIVLDELIKVCVTHGLTLCKEKLESMSRQLKADQFVSFIQ